GVVGVFADLVIAGDQRFHLGLLDRFGGGARLASSDLDHLKDFLIRVALQDVADLLLLPLVRKLFDVFDFANKIPNGLDRLAEPVVAIGKGNHTHRLGKIGVAGSAD